MADNKQPEQHDILQSVYNGITEAMNGVRHMVVEESCFNHENGRTVTDDIPIHDVFYAQPSWAAGLTLGYRGQNITNTPSLAEEP